MAYSRRISRNTGSAAETLVMPNSMFVCWCTNCRCLWTLCGNACTLFGQKRHILRHFSHKQQQTTRGWVPCELVLPDGRHDLPVFQFGLPVFRFGCRRCEFVLPVTL